MCETDCIFRALFDFVYGLYFNSFSKQIKTLKSNLTLICQINKLNHLQYSRVTLYFICQDNKFKVLPSLVMDKDKQGFNKKREIGSFFKL